jgi:hypothetical protein
MPVKMKYQALVDALVNKALARGWSQARLEQEQAHLDWMFAREMDNAAA